MYHDPNSITSEPLRPDDLRRCRDVVDLRIPKAEADGEAPRLRCCRILDTGTRDVRRSGTMGVDTETGAANA